MSEPLHIQSHRIRMEAERLATITSTLSHMARALGVAFNNDLGPKDDPRAAGEMGNLDDAVLSMSRSIDRTGELVATLSDYLFGESAPKGPASYREKPSEYARTERERRIDTVGGLKPGTI